MAQPHPLALMGDVIANAGAQYAANAQQRQQREQQLADIAAARAFQQQQIKEARDYQDYVREIEDITAEARTGAERDYSDYVRGEVRAAQKEDVEAARAFERESRLEGWKHEEGLYNARLHDAIKTQLMLDGHLNKTDFDKPEAFDAALAAGGPAYKELAAYKAAIPEILKSTRGDPGMASRISEILDMKASDIGRARELMKDAYGMIAKTVDSEKDQKELNAKNGALLMMAHMGKLAEIDTQKAGVTSEIERLAANRFTPPELAQIRKTALSKLTPDYQAAFARGAPSDKAKAALATEEAKAAEELKLIAESNLLARSKGLDNQMGRVATQYNGVQAAIQTGAAGYMDPKGTGWSFNMGEEGGPKEAPKVKVISREDAQKEADAFIGGGGATPAKAAPAPAPGTAFAAAPQPTVTSLIPPTTATAVPVPEVGAPPVIPPAAPPAAIAPEAPWWSLKGLYERRNQINQAVPEMLVKAPARFAAQGIAAGGQALDRALAAAGEGIYSGNYSIPERGLMGQLGERAGESIANTSFGPMPAQFATPAPAAIAGPPLPALEREDVILRDQPWSMQATIIRNRRGLPPPAPAPAARAFGQ